MPYPARSIVPVINGTVTILCPACHSVYLQLRSPDNNTDGSTIDQRCMCGTTIYARITCDIVLLIGIPDEHACRECKHLYHSDIECGYLVSPMAGTAPCKCKGY